MGRTSALLDYQLSPLGTISLAAAVATEEVVIPTDCKLVGIMIHSPGAVINTEARVEVRVNDANVSPTRVRAIYTAANLAGDVGFTFDMRNAVDEAGAINSVEDEVYLEQGDVVTVLPVTLTTATGLTAKVTFLFRKTGRNSFP